ncbi:MAG: hypothetical protein KF690_04210 [Bacteroidetes bacterium]|nr:hypothetical protein [Bacteroidota bacterium]
MQKAILIICTMLVLAGMGVLSVYQDRIFNPPSPASGVKSEAGNPGRFCLLAPEASGLSLSPTIRGCWRATSLYRGGTGISLIVATDSCFYISYSEAGLTLPAYRLAYRFLSDSTIDVGQPEIYRVRFTGGVLVFSPIGISYRGLVFSGAQYHRADCPEVIQELLRSGVYDENTEKEIRRLLAEPHRIKPPYE